MAEVQLFGDYLNLNEHSIAARAKKRAGEGREGRGGNMTESKGREEEKITEERNREQKRRG